MCPLRLVVVTRHRDIVKGTRQPNVYEVCFAQGIVKDKLQQSIDYSNLNIIVPWFCISVYHQ